MAVIGPAVASEAERAVAEQVGALLAAAGFAVVTGGLGGVMAAASAGAYGAGGITIGLLPGEDRAVAAADVLVAVPTGLGEARNVLVVRAADAVVAVGRGDGTLSELGLALKLRRPIAAIDSWEVSAGGVPDPRLHRVATAEDAVAWIVSQLAVAADG